MLSLISERGNVPCACGFHGAQGFNLIIFSDRKKFFDAFAISHITLCLRGSISVVILIPFAHEKYHNTKFPGQNADQKLRPEEITCQPVST